MVEPTGSTAARVVRVLPDVAGIDNEFDYSVPAHMSVQIGSIVRVDLNGRRVRGWVTGVDVTPPVGVRLLPLQKVSSRGPDQELIDLAGWAAHRWTGRRSFYLGTASPERNVAALPKTRPPSQDSAPEWTSRAASVLPLPPAFDHTPTVVEAVAAGPSLILVPSRKAAQRMVTNLHRAGHRNVVIHPEGWAAAAGGGVSAVGTRAAAWCPMPDLTSIVIVDAHDEAHQSEASPTWNAIDVAAERARRRDVPLLLISSVPRLALLQNRFILPVARSVQRDGWTALHVVDLRKTDPRSGRYTPRLVELLRSEKRVVCVLNRKGRAQLLVCAACDEVATCIRCSSSLRLENEHELVCRRCDTQQPVICRKCSSSRFKQLRAGVAKVKEELEALAQRPVGEVTGETDQLPSASVLIGTEAVLHRVGKADAVVFLEFDQELLATRYKASEDALVLLARAARITGGRARDGVVVVQTRLPDNEVIEAAVKADPARFVEIEEERRRELNWPPFSAIARISGAGAPAFIETLPGSASLYGPDENGNWLLMCSDFETLSDTLALGKRPKERLRIEVDPARI